MIAFSSKYFYKNHINEIKKFKNSSFETLHIFQGNEIIKNLINTDDQYLFLNDNDDLRSVKNININTKQLILTNFIENSENYLTSFLESLDILNNNEKIIVTSVNSKWNVLIYIFSRLGLIKSKFPKNYVNKKTLENSFNILGYTLTKHYTKQIFPFKLFYFGTFINNILELLLFRLNIGMTSYYIFKKFPKTSLNYSKSLIIPAKNEEGNLEELISRINLDKNTEIIFVIAKSTDNTLEKAKQISENSEKYKFIILEQQSDGKKNAVFEALNYVNNDLVAILDSDISVDPEELNNFFSVIENNIADFVNGTRLVYSMEKGSMRLLNNFGNRFFQKLVTFFIRDNITDTLCGTKVFKKELIENIINWDNSLKFKDPFGDFNLIFAAANLGEKIVDYPIHYRSRKYGKPQISRFKDGYKLFLNFLNSIIKLNVSKY